MTTTIAVINGPNLNLLGSREPDIYGRLSLEEIVQNTSRYAQSKDLAIHAVQSNSEGGIIDAIHEAGRSCAGIIINAGAYTHTSLAIHDALKAVSLPSIEVHLSNVHAREEYRKHSFIAGAVNGVIAGFGDKSYQLAIDAMQSLLLAK